MRWRVIAALLVVAASPARAEATFDGHFEQGGLVYGHTTPGARVTLDGQPVRLTPDGEFLLGFGRDAAAGATLDVTYPDGRHETKALSIAARAWDIQRIEGLPQKQVTPPPEDLARIKADAAEVFAARARDTDVLLFRSGFKWPAIGPISGVYGSQRILNGEPRQPHYGIDIAAPAGTPVLAAADGIVSMVNENMLLTGKTLILDHGYGLSSTYMHMSAITVKPGQQVKQGQMIGRIGATGRVTGPHVDWRVNLYQVRLDPALLVPPMPISPASGGAATATGPAASGSRLPSGD
ncbi:MAG TPA: M23 family metallopeptidase [Alphaproteobacteria bacterium]|nr:M23 family metallopeptidase [Alphaproteobacteria bacterium]